MMSTCFEFWMLNFMKIWWWTGNTVVKHGDQVETGHVLKKPEYFLGYWQCWISELECEKIQNQSREYWKFYNRHRSQVFHWVDNKIMNNSFLFLAQNGLVYGSIVAPMPKIHQFENSVWNVKKAETLESLSKKSTCLDPLTNTNIRNVILHSNPHLRCINIWTSWNIGLNSDQK